MCLVTSMCAVPTPQIGCLSLSWAPLDAPSSRTLGNHLHLKLAGNETLMPNVLGVDGHHHLWLQAAPWWPHPDDPLFALGTPSVREPSMLPAMPPKLQSKLPSEKHGFLSSCLHPISGLLVQVNLDFFPHSGCSFGMHSIRQGRKLLIHMAINVQIHV